MKGNAPKIRIRLSDVTLSIEPVSRSDTYLQVFERFNALPDLPALPVVDQPATYGMIDRASFFARYARAFGHELFAKKPVADVADGQTLCFDEDLPVTEAATAIASCEPVPPQAVMVLRDGLYRGYATTTNIMHAVARQAQDALDQLNQAQEELIASETLASLGQLVAGVAHEVNTPIGVALTAASYFNEQTGKLQTAVDEAKLRKSDLDAYLRIAGETSRMILANIEQAAALVQSFKQVAVDQTSQRIGDVDVNRLLADVAASIQMHFRHAGHKLLIDCDPVTRIRSNAGALTQVVTNLVMNANIHAFPDRTSGSVTMAARQVDGMVVVSIKDDGQGIAPENLPHVFEPFFTTKRGHGGTGLGLHIVHNLIYQTLAGRLSLTSEVGQGTTITIFLPLDIDQPDVVRTAPGVLDTASAPRRRRRPADAVL